MEYRTTNIEDIIEKMRMEPVERGAPHEKAAITDEIIKTVGVNKRYGYTYWLKKIGKCKFGEVLEMIKEVEKASAKYNKGGMMTNLLDKANKQKSNNGNN